MPVLDLAAGLSTLTALARFANQRWFGLPTTIGVTAIALVFAGGLVALEHLGVGFAAGLSDAIKSLDFGATLMDGMLSFLLFAGALHVDLGQLRAHRRIVAALATLGVALSTIVVALLLWFALDRLGRPIPLSYALLFGALISPTDPIAVLAILRKAGIAPKLSTTIVGESLFNDGVGLIVFLLALGLSVGSAATPFAALGMFAQAAGGGLVYGVLLGFAGYALLSRVDNYRVEVLITLAVVMGGYAAARHLNVSGPIAMVVAGLVIGTHGRAYAMSATTRERLDTFWELLDEMLNAVLFVLIGLEVFIVVPRPEHIVAAAAAVPIVLIARYVSALVPVRLLARADEFPPAFVTVLTWGGLRGGISVALALSLPPGPDKALLLTVTYAVVMFSILVQGTSIGPLVRKLGPKVQE